MYQKFISELHADSNELIEIGSGKGKSFKRKCYTLEEIQSFRPSPKENVYIGMFSKLNKSTKAASSNTTKVLWLDFDHTTIDKVKDRLKLVDVPKPSMLVNSGNGVHAYYKLNERIHKDKAIRIIKGLVSVTGSDPKAALESQLMRLPGTNNVKGEIKPCEIVESNSLVYSVKDFEKYAEKPKRASEGKAKDSVCMFDMPCIDNMLQGVCKGERNFALGRITKKLQQEGYTRSAALKVILAFNRRCEPPKSEREVMQDFNAYWDKDYKLLGCTIKDTRLQSILSNYCDRGQCESSTTVFNIDFDNSIGFNNRTVFKHYKDLTGYNVIILGLLLKYPEGLSREQLERFLYSPGLKKYVMCERIMFKTLEELESKKLIEYEKKSCNGKRNYKNFFVKALVQGNYAQGFTIVSNGALMGCIDQRITPTQLKLYVLLMKYGFNKGSAYPSNETLARELGITQQGVNKMLKVLEFNGYIQRLFTYPKGIKHTNYRLLI